MKIIVSISIRAYDVPENGVEPETIHVDNDTFTYTPEDTIQLKNASTWVKNYIDGQFAILSEKANLNKPIANNWEIF